MKVILTSEGQCVSSEYHESSFNIESSVYEVVRVIDGVALFLEDHYQRLLNSIEIQRIDFRISLPDFKRLISVLIEANRQMEGNIKFVCFASDDKCKWALSFIPHSYPTSNDYINGVNTELLAGERNNPNAKVIQSELRLLANKTISDKQLYEVLLVNQEGKITEGSRSNIFFCKSGVFYTAPAAMVLEGITRQKVIRCIEKLKLHLVEEAVSVRELNNFDAAFITGTSPKVLPIKSIGKLTFNVQNEAVSELMAEYDRLIGEYIAGEKQSR